VINQKLGWLYRRYDTKRRFIRCGVVNEKTYLRSSPRLVIVLREPNSSDRDWSLPKFLREELERFERGQKFQYPYFWKTWKPIGIWSYAIHRGFDKYANLDSERIAVKGLSYIGMTNLKKTGGRSTAHYPTIKKHAEKYRDLWQNELEIMDPEIILCGGTFEILAELLGLKPRKTRTGLRYAQWELNGHRVLLVGCNHPASRESKKQQYNELRKALLELHKKGLWHSRSVS